MDEQVSDLGLTPLPIRVECRAQGFCRLAFTCSQGSDQVLHRVSDEDPRIPSGSGDFEPETRHHLEAGLGVATFLFVVRFLDAGVRVVGC